MNNKFPFYLKSIPAHLAFTILTFALACSATAQSIESIEPSSGKSGTAFEVNIKGTDTNFSQSSSKVKVIPGEDVKVKEIIVKNKTELIATISIAPDAEHGTRSFIITTKIEGDKTETVEAKNAFTVIPSGLGYPMVQRGEIIKRSIIPNEPVMLRFPEKNIIIDIKIFPETGTMEERSIRRPYGEHGPYCEYDIGTFSAGDRVEINIEDEEGDLLVGARTMHVRPGPVSIRSGIIVLPRQDLIRTQVSVFSRFYRAEAKKLLKIPFREISWIDTDAVFGWGFGFGMSIENDPRVYTAGIDYELQDMIDITFGGAGWTDVDSDKFKSDYYLGVTFDLRLFKKILDTVTTGFTLK